MPSAACIPVFRENNLIPTDMEQSDSIPTFAVTA